MTETSVLFLSAREQLERIASGKESASDLLEASIARSGIRLSWTDDGGKTFSLPVMASTKTLDSNHPAFAMENDGNILLLFQARDPWQKGGWTPPRP